MDNDKRGNVIAFLIGLFFGRWGVPILIHVFYLTSILILWIKILLK
jgi:hypothetical protein